MQTKYKSASFSWMWNLFFMYRCIAKFQLKKDRGPYFHFLLLGTSQDVSWRSADFPIRNYLADTSISDSQWPPLKHMLLFSFLCQLLAKLLYFRVVPSHGAFFLNLSILLLKWRFFCLWNTFCFLFLVIFICANPRAYSSGPFLYVDMRIAILKCSSVPAIYLWKCRTLPQTPRNRTTRCVICDDSLLHFIHWWPLITGCFTLVNPYF